jgi:hypothetical protein
MAYAENFQQPHQLGNQVLYVFHIDQQFIIISWWAPFKVKARFEPTTFRPVF